MTETTWQPVTVRLADLTPWERNPKRISKSHAGRLLDLWQRLGQFQTIAIGPAGEVYDGHQRLSVLKAAHGGKYEVQALQSSRALTEQEREELTIAAHSGTTGTWDWDALSGWDAGNLQQWGFDGETLQNWQADIGALSVMLASEEEPPPDDPGAQIDKAEELRELWGVHPGQLWQLGEHRLVVGDCTDAAVVARVMGGEIANLALTDPPYNVGFDYGGEVNDSKTTDEYEQWSLGWFDAACGVSEKITFTPGGVNLAMWLALMDVTAIGAWIKSGNTGGAHGAISMFQCWEPIVFCVNKQFQHKRKYEFTDWLRASGVTSRQIDEATNSNMGGHYLTIKSQPAIPTARMWHKIKHLFEDVPSRISELIENRIDDGFGRLRHTDVFDYSPTDGVDTRHVCPKPTSLWEDIIRNYSEVGGAVYDPFLGSGTTLIACERLGRRCRAVEISPAYCAVAIQRWHDMTGGEPVLIG